MLLGTRTLQPTKENLGSVGIGDCALPQALFDLGVTRRLPCTACCAARVTPRAAGLQAARGCLQPTEKNLSGTGIRDRAVSQTTLDPFITRRLTATAGWAGSVLKRRC